MDRFELEWDDAKAASNYVKHGVTFDKAAEAFRDIFAVEEPDVRDYGEERANLLGRVGESILRVTYTERGNRIRIISARQAKRHERETYYRENSR